MFHTDFHVQYRILFYGKQTSSKMDYGETQAMRQKSYHLIFATDGKGTTQLAHVYAETLVQASDAATRWRDEQYPDLRILRVRAEPNGFRVGSFVLPPSIEEEEEGATFADVPDVSLPSE